jgi:hypothetical protein
MSIVVACQSCEAAGVALGSHTLSGLGVHGGFSFYWLHLLSLRSSRLCNGSRGVPRLVLFNVILACDSRVWF